METHDRQQGVFIYAGNAYKMQEDIINKPIHSAAESQSFSNESPFTTIYTLLHWEFNTTVHKLIYREMPHFPNVAEILKNKLCSVLVRPHLGTASWFGCHNIRKSY